MGVKFEIAGVNSLLLRFAEQVDAATVARIGFVTQQIRESLGEQIVDLVPSYTTLLVTYDLLQNDDRSMHEKLQVILSNTDNRSILIREGRLVELPVCYESQYAPDISELSSRLSLSRSEIIRLHSEIEYQVYAIGFSPGFGYLGELNPLLRMPRRATPRTSVPAGSVAIAEQNTAVYPQQTPGGWWLIGRCPVAMFDANREPPCRFEVGDRVRFTPISSAEYKSIGGNE